MVVKIQSEPKEILHEKQQAPGSGEPTEGGAEVQSHTGCEFSTRPQVYSGLCKKVPSCVTCGPAPAGRLLLGILWTHF